MSALANSEAQGDAPTASRLDQSYLAGIGLSGVAVAIAGVSFVMLAGAVSFDLWPKNLPERPGAAAELGPGVDVASPAESAETGGVAVAPVPTDDSAGGQQAPGSESPGKGKGAPEQGGVPVAAVPPSESTPAPDPGGPSEPAGSQMKSSGKSNNGNHYGQTKDRGDRGKSKSPEGSGDADTGQPSKPSHGSGEGTGKPSKGGKPPKAPRGKGHSAAATSVSDAGAAPPSASAWTKHAGKGNLKPHSSQSGK